MKLIGKAFVVHYMLGFWREIITLAGLSSN
jgi:hypothetical protein